MNSKKAKHILTQYKQYFTEINKEEIYKWRAIKCFQDNWDIEASDFYRMIEMSLGESKNLLDSMNYFPKRMLLKNIEKSPEYIRELFVNLFDESTLLQSRLKAFHDNMKSLTEMQFEGAANYQDYRAIMVYLTMRFPDKYYLYKPTMFRQFIDLIDYPYHYVRANEQNVPQYLNLCKVLKDEILMDKELLELHKTRITDNEYLDTSYNLLTQDVIYAAVKHIKNFEQNEKQDSSFTRLIKVETEIIPDDVNPVILKGKHGQYEDNARENKRIGDLGELLVFQHEMEKFERSVIKMKPIHKSKLEGDGLGYDILSYNNNGQERYIEVKTTKGPRDTAFYVTQPELIKSQIEKANFVLYRLYEFDDLSNSAKFFEIQGDLERHCVNPVVYYVNYSIQE